MQPKLNFRGDFLLRLLTPPALVVAEIVIAKLVSDELDARVSMVFVSGSLICGLLAGTAPALATAVLSTIAYGAFVAHQGLDGVGDAVTLTFFLGVSVLTGGLAGRVRDQGLRERDRADAVSRLFNASREMAVADQEDDLRATLSRHLRRIFGNSALIFANGQLYGNATGPEAQTIAAALRDGRNEIEGWIVKPLRAADKAGDALLVRREQMAAGADIDTLALLADLAAATLDRSRLAAVRAEAEAAAEGERLRNALLSSVSHDFRTPLASILASAGSLRCFGETFTPAVREELLRTIESEADRLNRFVANLLNMTRLESSALDMLATTVDVEDLIADAPKWIERISPDTKLAAHFPSGLAIRVDPLLFEHALRNIVENAARHGPAAGCIHIEARETRDAVEIVVDDEGPGVPAQELERIFEKFYRLGPDRPDGGGTGLGLSIARGLIEAMDGRIHAEAAPTGGLRMVLSFPQGDHCDQRE